MRYLSDSLCGKGELTGGRITFLNIGAAAKEEKKWEGMLNKDSEKIPTLHRFELSAALFVGITIEFFLRGTTE